MRHLGKGRGIVNRITRLCEVDGCERKYCAKGMCNTHWMRAWRAAKAETRPAKAVRLCDIEGCERKHQAKGMCSGHYNRICRRADPDMVRAKRESGRAYRQANRENIRERSRSYGLANRKKLRESNRARRSAYGKANRGKLNEYQRAWQKANRQKVREYVRAYRAQKRNQLGHVSPGLEARLMEAQKGRCLECRRRFTKARPDELDHIIPLAKGGLHDDGNLQLLCRSCNRSKNARDPVEWAQSKGRLF